MTDQGFIKIHRSILKWEWWKDANTMRVFMYLLLNANWEDSKFMGHDVPKGSLVTSYASIANALNISVKNTRTAIKHLKSTGEVAIKTASKFSIITVINWEKFQGYENEVASKVANEVAGKRQASGNIKEYKEYKNIKNYFNSESQNGRNKDFVDFLEKESKNGR